MTTQRQSSEVNDDDDSELVQRVLLKAVSALFCCFLVLTLMLVVLTLSHRRLSRGRRHTSQQRERRRGDGRCRTVVTDVFVLVTVVYSLAFTFSAMMVACRLIATQTDVNLVVGEDSVVEVLTTATTALRRRLAELERLGGLSGTTWRTV